MTSFCDVINSAYEVTITTIRHCSILEFGSGAYNQAVAPGITRPLYATAPVSLFVYGDDHPSLPIFRCSSRTPGHFDTHESAKELLDSRL